MRTMRWIGALGVGVLCLGAGLASGSEDGPGKPQVRVDSKTPGKPEGTDHRRVNVNQASKTDLMKLDGVTAGMAQKIIAYREAHGPFKRAHDLARVDGVSREVLDRNASRITVK
jgi:competence ComEA-like helix-hairpin-helix protein